MGSGSDAYTFARPGRLDHVWRILLSQNRAMALSVGILQINYISCTTPLGPGG